MKVKKRVISFIFCIILIFGNILSVFGANFVNKEIKVGYFHLDGYHMIGDNGEKSGYGFEILQKMLIYLNWNYKYVGYDKGWKEMQDMLLNGEIDLLTSARKTDEMLNKFDFSDKPIGTSSTIITSNSKYNNYFVGNYSNWNNVRVGMLKNNTIEESFKNYADTNNFTYSTVYFNSVEELEQATRNNNLIDISVTNSLRQLDDETVIDRFDPEPFYIIVQKGNKQLLNEINSALAKLEDNYIDISEDLYSKYYSPKNFSQIAFTAEEREYIDKCIAEEKEFSGVINPDREPYSYFDENDARGIQIELINKIVQRTGLKIKICKTSNRDQYNETINDSKTSLWFTLHHDYDFAQKNGYILTEPYFTTTISKVYKKNFVGNANKVAVLQTYDYSSKSLNDIVGNVDIVYYDSAKECINAVKRGKVDATYLYSYTAQKMIDLDETNKLACSTVPHANTAFSIGVRETENPMLASIINKAAMSISEKDINEAVNNNVEFGKKQLSLIGYMYYNPLLFATMILFVSFGAILLIITFFQNKGRIAERKLSFEFERFIVYVCSAYDLVSEINLHGKTKTEYSVVNGKVYTKVDEYDGGYSYKVRIHPDDLTLVKQYWNKKNLSMLIDTNKNCYFECRLKNYNGDYEWFSFLIMGVAIDIDHPYNVMINIRNINNAKLQEQVKVDALRDALSLAEQANEAKSVFLSRISHEIRTPLNAMIGYTSIAKETCESPPSNDGQIFSTEKVVDCLNKSEIAAKHLLGIINDVLDVSSIESGKMKLAYEKFDLKNFMDSITQMFYAQSKNKNINFSIIVNNVENEKLIGDQLRLNQIFLNLLSNAFKFTGEGGNITLEITQLNIINNKVFLRFVVNDSGIGMKDEFKKRLFKPFEQQDSSIFIQYGGTGLGLSITKNLVNMMDGVISVESSEGVGTSFTIDIPIQLDNDGVDDSYSNDNLPKNILFIDDNDKTLSFVSNILEKINIKCKTAKKIDNLIEHNYNVIIIDWNLFLNCSDEKKQELVNSFSNSLIVFTAYNFIEIYDSDYSTYAKRLIKKPIFKSSVMQLLNEIYGDEEHKKKEITEDKELLGTTVLLVEDNEMNMEIASDLLKSRGINVDCAENGKIALEKYLNAEPYKYNIILTDIHMPLLDGYELTRKIRESNRDDCKSITIIAMTANVFTEDVSEALAQGMNDHISKPINVKSMFKTLLKYTQKN